MVAAYEKAAILKYTTCFDNCEDDTEVHDDKNIPNGAFLHFTASSGHDSVLERPLYGAKRPHCNY